jgi:hypothetical protein
MIYIRNTRKVALSFQDGPGELFIHNHAFMLSLAFAEAYSIDIKDSDAYLECY